VRFDDFEIMTQQVRSRFAWAHAFDPDRSIAATFQTLPGASLVVSGAGGLPVASR
jgi:uncharacterized protein with beta-barrel porin domain